MLLFLLGGIVWMAWGAASVSDATTPFEDTPTPTLAPGTGAIAGRAWHDLDADGMADAGEPPLAGMTVSLSQAGQVISSVVTGADGSYRFTALIPKLYRLDATPPAGYQMTTPAQQSVFVGAGTVLQLDFGALFVPTATPTVTPPPMIDIESAVFAYCGGVVTGDTRMGANRVSQYACRPSWREDGPELVYRIELGRAQPLSAVLLSTQADLDLFLLPSAYPETCLAGADAALTYDVQPGVYFLVVDGYQGATGAFQMRLECPYGLQATITPTPTASRTPSPTPTLPPTATATPTPTTPPKHNFLPLILIPPSPTPIPQTVVLQQGASGYGGAEDTWISAWPGEDSVPHGGDGVLRFFYNRGTAISTHRVPLLRFDLTALPADATVVKAELRLYVTEPPVADVRVAVHGMLRPWAAATATWVFAATGQAWSVGGAQGSGADHLATAADVQQVATADQWYGFDVTPLAGDWLRTPGQNAGVILLARSGDSQREVATGFASSDHGELSLRPQLVISYWVP